MVRRPSPAGAPGEESLTAADGIPPLPGANPPATRSEIIDARENQWKSRIGAHWMMRAGVVIALMGLLLLKFG